MASSATNLSWEFADSGSPADDFAGAEALDAPSSIPGNHFIVDALPMPALVACRNEIVHVNAPFCRLAGCEDPGEIVGRRLEELFVGIPDLSEFADAREARPAGSTAILRSDGSLRRVELKIGILDGGEARPWALFLLHDDAEARATMRAFEEQVKVLERTLENSTTRYAEITRELHDAKDAADAANRTKSEFLANMSHELRTPLNAIMGFSEVIKDEMFGTLEVPQYIEYARDIFNSGAHLLDIINDILDLSKVEAGKFELNEEKVEINEVLGAVINLIKGRASEKDQEIEITVAHDFPVLFADRRGLKQILLNLLSNAVKFTGDGGRIVIRASVDSGGPVIAVADNGIGIAESDMEKVMRPFGQVDSALARDHQGTGLGLPLVLAMVRLHGGEFELDSTLDEGTTAYARFPMERACAPDTP